MLGPLISGNSHIPRTIYHKPHILNQILYTISGPLTFRKLSTKSFKSPSAWRARCNLLLWDKAFHKAAASPFGLMHILVCDCVYACVYVHIYTHLGKSTNKGMYMYISPYICMYRHTYMYACIYIYTYATAGMYTWLPCQGGLEWGTLQTAHEGPLAGVDGNPTTQVRLRKLPGALP